MWKRGKQEIDSLKQAFYKLHNAEQEATKKLFIENGGVAENFIPTTDAVEEEFKNIMSVIKEREVHCQLNRNNKKS